MENTPLIAALSPNHKATFASEYNYAEEFRILLEQKSIGRTVQTLSR